MWKIIKLYYLETKKNEEWTGISRIVARGWAKRIREGKPPPGGKEKKHRLAAQKLGVTAGSQDREGE